MILINKKFLYMKKEDFYLTCLDVDRRNQMNDN